MEHSEGIFMSKKEEFRFTAVSSFLSGKLSRIEVATLIQVTERTVSRIARRIEKKGFLAVTHAIADQGLAINHLRFQKK